MIKNKYNTIYLLENIINGKKYVGQTWYSCQNRMQKNGSGYRNSIYLYGALKKYGTSNFKYTILGTAQTQEEADLLEIFYIDKLDSRNSEKGYNIRAGGSAGKHSDETKSKISKSLTGLRRSEETCRKISKLHLGLRKPPHSEEWKINNSEFMKKRHMEHGHPFFGKHHSEGSILKISQTLTGRKHSKERVDQRAESRMESQEIQNQVIADYLANKTINEIKEKFGFGGNGKVYRILDKNNIPRLNNHSKWSGRTHSQETKEKISKSKTEYWKIKS